MAPLITVATANSKPKAPPLAKVTTMGVTNAITAIDVPIAVEIKAEIKKIPGSNNFVGRTLIVKLAIKSALPIDEVTVENAPENKNIKHIVIMFLLPMPSITVLILSWIFSLLDNTAKNIAGSIQTIGETRYEKFST